MCPGQGIFSEARLRGMVSCAYRFPRCHVYQVLGALSLQVSLITPSQAAWNPCHLRVKEEPIKFTFLIIAVSQVGLPDLAAGDQEESPYWLQPDQPAGQILPNLQIQLLINEVRIEP